MTNNPSPCPVCGGVHYQVLPGMLIDVWHATTVLGMAAVQKLGGGVRWTVTAVICRECGRTETFTTNTDEIAKHVPGAYVV